jgi:hypothetical protein
MTRLLTSLYWAKTVEIPGDEYPPTEQACVILKSSEQKDTAKAFLNFIKTPAVAELFRSNGFAVPVQHKTRKYKLKIISEGASHENVSLIGRCRFFDALKDAVAAEQEQNPGAVGTSDRSNTT